MDIAKSIIIPMHSRFICSLFLASALFLVILPKAHAQIEVHENAPLKVYVGRYEIVKEMTIDMKDEHGKYVFITMHNLDHAASPFISFMDSNKEATALLIKSAAKIEVTLSKVDEKKIAVTYFDPKGQTIYVSTLSPL